MKSKSFNLYYHNISVDHHAPILCDVPQWLHLQVKTACRRYIQPTQLSSLNQYSNWPVISTCFYNHASVHNYTAKTAMCFYQSEANLNTPAEATNQAKI